MSKKIYLKDVCGYEEEKDEIKKIITLLKNYELYENQGVHIPRGLIFQGPPGTGKTLLANAISNECGFKFYSVFNEDYQEYPLDTLKKTFKEAEAYTSKTGQPCIIYIDEIDKLVYVNPLGELPDSDVREAIRFLLQKLDTPVSSNRVLIIASTNKYHSLPDALLRSGRFDKKLLIDLPDYASRVAILTYYINNHKLFSEIDIKKLAVKTNGMSGADLKTLINNTLLEYVTVKETLELDDFIKIINEMNFETIGKSWKSNNEATRILAHEVGHAIVSRYLNGTFGTISVLKYGDVAGVTSPDDVIFEEDEEMYDVQSLTVKDVLNEICVCLGGKAGEEVFLNEKSLGIISDINRVSNLYHLLSACGVFGFKYSFSVYDRQPEPRLLRKIQLKTVKFVEKMYKKTLKLLKKHKSLGIYLIEEIHNNGDVMSSENLEDKEKFFIENKKELTKKYKKLNLKTKC